MWMNLTIRLSTSSQFPWCTQLVCILYFLSGDVAAQFTAAPPTCPGGTFTFRCTVTGDRNGYTIWRVGGSSGHIFSLSTVGAVSTCGPGNTLTARSGTGFGGSGASYSSTLSGTATSALNGSYTGRVLWTRLCQKCWEHMVGSTTLQLSGQWISLYCIFTIRVSAGCCVA